MWLVGLALLAVLAGSLGSRFADGGRLEGSDSDAAYQLLARDLPDVGGDTADIVVHHDAGLDDPVVVATVSAFRAEVADRAGSATSDLVVAPDGRTGVFSVGMPEPDLLDQHGEPVASRIAHDLERAAGPPRAEGLQVEFGGEWFQRGDVPASAEQIGLVVAVVVLLVLFGSLVASGVTLLPALLSVAASGAVVTLVSRVISTPDVTTEVATMIGLGVGIDYGLFIITRFRQELTTRPPDEALRIAMSTAGRAVLLAGGTVAISLLGMLLIGMEFLHGLSIGAAVAVGVAVLGSFTLLPALLKWSTGPMQRRARRQRTRSRADVAWARLGESIARRPLAALIAGLVALIVLAAPVVGMRLAGADAGNDPAGSTTRRAYDLVAGAFGPGSNGPLLVVVPNADPSSVDRLSMAIAGTTGVAQVTPAVVADHGTTVLTVIPTTAPQDAQTEELVHRLRDDVIPDAGVEAHVGGATASNVDFAEALRSRLPVFIGGVLACSFLLLLIVFRSVLVPLKAVLLNLLSIAAAFGAMVAVFQWGWFGSLFGVESGAPIEPWAPMLLFAIVFGLSMDYEVFLLSAVKERYDETGDNRSSVVHGLASTGRVITAAAAIMVAVFGGFLRADLRAVQLIGFGLAVAVLIDATIVRLVLVPASMELLGDRNWWLPRWLEQLLPRVAIEQGPAEGSAAARAEPLDDGLGGVDRDGEADVRRGGPVAASGDGGVDADDLTLGVHEWPPGVAGADRGVGLDEARQ